MFIIPTRRLGIVLSEEELAKAAGFSRGPREGHKYVKRELRGYKNGRAIYRYWYADDIARDSAKAGKGAPEESDEQNEHVLLDTLKTVFANLADKSILPSQVSETSLAEALATGAKVIVSAPVIDKHHKPHVEAEKRGDEVLRTPLARIQHAFTLLPQEIKQILAKSKFHKVDIHSWEEDTVYGAKAKGRGKKKAVLGYANPAGRVAILSNYESSGVNVNAFEKPEDDGPSRFMSRKTQIENVVWHELGHEVHFAKPELLKSWFSATAGEKTRISSYAYTNEKEDFCESFSCAMSHPQQLAKTCPARYDFLQKNVLTSLPPRSEMLAKDPEELAWWTGRASSKSAKLAAAMGKRAPISYVDIYQSAKDQFYSLMYKGRQIFFRVGPKDREEEDGWDRMPDTIDPETGLPVFDKTVAQRFRAKENIKEIYDDKGNALDPEQALLWLRQDDEAFQTSLPDTYDEYLDLPASAKTTRSLAYQLFIALGENRGMQEEERERVKAARDKPERQLDTLKKKLAKLEARPEPTDPEAKVAYDNEIDIAKEEISNLEDAIKSGSKDFAALDRHKWAPIEMSASEFIGATPTFKFTAMREDPEKSNYLFTFDQKAKKRIPRIEFNPNTGKEERVKASTAYTMDNPDGTTTKIEVCETDPFHPGQKILAPFVRDFVDEATGEKHSEQVWESYVIPTNHSADPARLARELGTTIEELLKKNARFAKGQIMDPLLANLINPDGSQIRNAGDLIAKMREAARRQASAWITVTGGSPDSPTNAHVKVTFDGGGNPIVAGDYWARRMGKQPGMRLDQLIDKANKIKLDRVVEEKIQKVAIEEGALAQYIDPKTGRKIYGRIAKIDSDEDGKPIYRMKPIKGQGAGVERKNARVSKVEAATDDIVPDDLSMRRRKVKAMKSDVLLYLDNIVRERIDAKGKPAGRITKGIIKIKPPADGSISMSELSALPGVRTVVTTDVHGAEETELIIDQRDLGVLREAFGGFVMDEYVTERLRDQGTEQRKRSSTLVKEVVAPTQIASEDGTVNTGPDGLMQGLRARTPDGKEFKLGSHQIEALQAIARGKGRQLLGHFMGCLSGDTEIPINRAGKGFKLKLRDLAARHAGRQLRGPSWNPEIQTMCTSLFGEHLRLNQMLDCYATGVKTTYELRTKSGRIIRATEEHPFMTRDRGWLALRDLRTGDRLVVRGRAEGIAPQRKEPYPYVGTLYHHPYAGIRGAKANPFRVPKHRLVIEAKMNGIEYNDFLVRCRTGRIEDLSFLDPAEYAVHHKDGDIQNFDVSNLEVIKHHDHWKMHGEESGWQNFAGFHTTEDEIEFIGDEREEETFDISMHPMSSSYLANDFVVHNTGKTVSAIAAIQMMRNLKDPEKPTEPAPGSPRKRVLIVVPLNTINQWESAVSFFTEGRATVMGASTLPGAQQAFKWPKRGENETEAAYQERVKKLRDEAVKGDTALWNPDASSDIVVVPEEYYTQNEHDLRTFGGFDGLVIDEAHSLANAGTEISQAVKRWNPSMNMLLALTGTPVTNKLDTLPQLLDIVSNGRAPLGDKQSFSDRYMAPSKVMLALGSKKPPRTDINPQYAAELGAILQQYMHVAMPEDVRGKTMPAVLLDENQPAHMIGMQEKMYRAAMASLTEEDRERLEQSSSLGVDEEQLLSEEAKAKVQIARNFANSPGYKAPDSEPFRTYKEEIAVKTKKGTTEMKEETKIFQFPDHDAVTRGRPSGWGGKWPTRRDVGKLFGEAYYDILQTALTDYFGTDYEKNIAGKPISKEHLAEIKLGTINGRPWSKIANPEYGPEGAIARGVMDAGGDLVPMRAQHNGEWIDVPIGTKFIRAPGAKKAAGIYYIADDWNFDGTFKDSAEGGTKEGDTEAEGSGEEKKREGVQGPKAGREAMNVTRHPSRRRERAMFDAAMTHGNAKCDELERYFEQHTNTEINGPKAKDKQFILFGNRVGSSCRTMEAKVRQMGYQDVNEALGADPNYASDDDRARMPSQGYFVTYFGVQASTGNRDINSEIFRKVKNASGQDTETSMFVHRTLTGSIGKPPSVGDFAEGWTRAERKKISKLFVGPKGQPNVEIPMRVTRMEDGRLGYVYESDISEKKGGKAVLAEIKKLEDSMRGMDPEARKGVTAKLATIFAQHVTDRAPLSQHQMDVFNNCKVMIASDAAQVGLNWGNASELVMYDSLHSPMLEWQRITRAARMLDAIVPDKAQPHFDKLGAAIEKMERANNFEEYANLESALPIVQEAFDGLSQSEKNEMLDMGFNPVVAAEAYFAKRAFDRVNTLRKPVLEKLRTVGRELEPVERYDEESGASTMHRRYVHPEAITNADVMNEIVEKHLTPFEREILKSRKYLVNVKRLTTSVAMPEFVVNKIKDPETGRKKLTREWTGQYVTEVPAKAELSTLMQGRAKQVPYEYLLKLFQDKHEIKTDYDFLTVNPSSLGKFSVLPTDAKPNDIKPTPIAKALPSFYIRGDR